jgi:hypothetical protein
MDMPTHLNEIDQEQLLADFEDWSGGFPPEECALCQIKKLPAIIVPSRHQPRRRRRVSN